MYQKLYLKKALKKQKQNKTVDLDQEQPSKARFARKPGQSRYCCPFHDLTLFSLLPELFSQGNSKCMQVINLHANKDTFPL